MFTALKRIIRAGWLNFSRHAGISAATIFIMVLTITMISSLFLLKGVSEFLIATLQEKVDISVYFKATIEEDDILRAKDELAKVPEVKEVRYISREEALARFIERYKNNETIMESLRQIGNPLLASLNIKAWQASQYSAITDFFDKPAYKELVDKVDYQERKPVIEKVFSLSANVNRTGLIFAAVLAVFAVLVAFNAIRMAIHDSREEIGVMRLVGASNLFIRLPFVLQGSLCGIIAGLLSLTLLAAATYFLSPKVEMISGFNLWQYFNANFRIVLAIDFAAAIILGIFSSAIAVRKYLRV